MTRIVIADDHTIVRKGLKEVLADSPDLVVAAECSNGQDLLSLVEHEKFDLVLLDLTMQGLSGLDTLKQLKSLKPHLPVLVLTMHHEEQYAIRAFNRGASGYITKDSAADELVTAVRKVTRGGRYVSSPLAEKIALSFMDHRERKPHELLSDREYQILCMIAAGKTISGIAEELSLSTKTISTYRTRLLRKMHMKNNVEIFDYASSNGLINT
jgi:two-component system, NarL family, invasion response regulator UvrY